MRVIIQDERTKFEIKAGDIFYEPIAKDIYVMNKLEGAMNIYELMILDGTGEKYKSTNLTRTEIELFINRGELIHYSKDKYQLELWKINGE